MKHFWKTLAAVLIITSSATGQVICNRIGNYTYCNGQNQAVPYFDASRPASAAFDATALINMLNQRRMQQQQRQEYEEEQARLANEQARREQAASANVAYSRKYGSLIAAGKCEEAKTTALQDGKFEYLDIIKKACEK